MHPFNDATRRNIAARCVAFTPLPLTDGSQPLKRAAVAIALTASDHADTVLLLTRRAASLRSHGGQWALPGGRCDAGESAIEAALRELQEELGLVLGADAVLGQLDDYPTRSGYLIRPVVVWCGEPAAIVPNPDEVASVHCIALDTIEHRDAFDFVRIPESTRPVIRFHHDGGLIHAPTAAVIYQFREVLAGRSTRVGELEQPVFAWR